MLTHAIASSSVPHWQGTPVNASNAVEATDSPVDPALQAALEQATANLNDAGSAADKAVWQDLVDEINYEIKAQGNMADVKEWYNEKFNDQDPYMQYYAADPATLQEEFTLINGRGSTMPAPLPIDNCYRYARAYLDTLTPGSDDYTLINDLCQKLWNAGWQAKPADIAALDTWATNLIMNTDPNSEYKKASSAAQNAFLQGGGFLLSVAYIAALKKSMTLPEGSPDYNCLQDFMNEILNLINAGKDDGKSLNQWYQANFATQDAYMQYYNVDPSILQFIWSIASDPSQPMPPPTSNDTNYLALKSYLNTLSPGADYNLIADLCDQYFAIGSNPSSSQIDQFNNWIYGFMMDPNSDFYKASSAAQQEFLDHCGFYGNYAFDSAYLNNWAASHPASYDQQFAEQMSLILQGYMQSQIDPSKLSKTDFQNYLNEYFSDTDFCFQIAGLSPTDIDSIYKAFGMTDPYQYGPVDTAYASANQTYQTLYPDPNNPPPAGSPDDVVFNGDGSSTNPGLFQELIECQNGDISMDDAKAWVKKLILWLQENTYNGTTYWSQVSSSAQQLLENIENQ